MYQVVKLYNDKLKSWIEDGYLYKDCSQKERICEIHQDAAKELGEIFVKYNWSEEFVISFSLYCNFFILCNLHNLIGLDECINKIKGYIYLNYNEQEYLHNIFMGIYEQNVDYFYEALDMDLYDFDIPKYYIFVLSTLELCNRDDDDFNSKEELEDILAWYTDREIMKKNISGELLEFVEPLELELREEAQYCAESYMLLPRILVSDESRIRMITTILTLDRVSNICNTEITNFDDIMNAYNEIVKEDHTYPNGAKKIQVFLYAVQEFFNLAKMNESDEDSVLYSGKDEEEKEGDYFDRKNYLGLPALVSDKQYINITVSRLHNLNNEKKDLIKKNERMVEDYSHSIENIMKPALIADIAEVIKADKNNKDLYKKILHIYYSEIMTQNECRLLKMLHNVSVSKGAIREQFAKVKIYDDSNKIRMEDLVTKALNQIALQLVEDQKNDKFVDIMANLEKLGITRDILDSKLWNSGRESKSIYDLFRNKMSFELNISTEVDNHFLNQEEVGTTFIYTRILDLLINSLSQGKFGENSIFKLNMYFEKDEYLEGYFVMESSYSTENRLQTNMSKYDKQGTIAAMLERVNIEDYDKKEFLKETISDNICSIKIIVDADLYFDLKRGNYGI